MVDGRSLRCQVNINLAKVEVMFEDSEPTASHIWLGPIFKTKVLPTDTKSLNPSKKRRKMTRVQRAVGSCIKSSLIYPISS